MHQCGQGLWYVYLRTFGTFTYVFLVRLRTYFWYVYTVQVKLLTGRKICTFRTVQIFDQLAVQLSSSKIEVSFLSTSDG